MKAGDVKNETRRIEQEGMKIKSGYCQCLIDDVVGQKTSTDHSITHVLLSSEYRGVGGR
jgi:hypothetical protein